MSRREEYSTMIDDSNQCCDGTREIVKYSLLFGSMPSYLLYQHVPASYARMNEYLPHHMYFSNVTPPFSMSQVPASLLLNRLVMKRKIKFSRGDDRNQRRVAFIRSESALSCVWMPLNDYIVTAWNNGKIVKMNGVNYQFNLQQDVDAAAFCNV